MVLVATGLMKMQIKMTEVIFLDGGDDTVKFNELLWASLYELNTYCANVEASVYTDALISGLGQTSL